MQPYIVCPKCGMISHSPNDVRERYCGNCHAFHADRLSAGAITVNRIADGAVSQPAIAAGAVHENRLADGAVTPANCPKCGAELLNITCLGDTRWQYLCVGCGATIEGELIDPEYAAAERRKFDALAEAMRRADRGE